MNTRQITIVPTPSQPSACAHSLQARPVPPLALVLGPAQTFITSQDPPAVSVETEENGRTPSGLSLAVVLLGHLMGSVVGLIAGYYILRSVRPEQADEILRMLF